MRHPTGRPAVEVASSLVFLDPHRCPQIPSNARRQLFDLFRPYQLLDRNRCQLMEKPSYGRISEVSYLGFGRQPSLGKDGLDDDFETNMDAVQATRFEILGYHTYGGYWGFFRPDLDEVLRLFFLHPELQRLDLNTVDRIYVTTNPYPSPDISHCYDKNEDRHKAKTRFAVVLNS